MNTSISKAPDPLSPGWRAPEARTPDPASTGWKPPANRSITPGSAQWKSTLNKQMRERIKTPPGVFLFVSLAALTIILAASWYAIGSILLQQELMSRTWERYDGIELTLDFDDDTIDYNAMMYFFGQRKYDIADIEYRVTSPTTIEIKTGDSWTNIEVDLDKNQHTLWFHPAITSSDSSELWY